MRYGSLHPASGPAAVHFVVGHEVVQEIGHAHAIGLEQARRAEPGTRRRGRNVAEVTRRVWKVGRVRKFAWGFTLQVPCQPCPHKAKNGEVAHPRGVRQERVSNAAWTEDDARKERAARLLGLTGSAAPVPAITLGAMVEKFLAEKRSEGKRSGR